MTLDTTVFFVSHFIKFTLLMTVNAGLVYATVILFRRISKV